MLAELGLLRCTPCACPGAPLFAVLQMTGDGEVEVSATTISLRCPLSACRITAPARFACSSGLACASCFDLNSFLEMAMRTGKWQCPVTSCLVTVGQLQLEPYLAAVLKALKAADLLDSVEEVEVAPGGGRRGPVLAGLAGVVVSMCVWCVCHVCACTRARQASKHARMCHAAVTHTCTHAHTHDVGVISQSRLAGAANIGAGCLFHGY